MRWDTTVKMVADLLTKGLDGVRTALFRRRGGLKSARRNGGEKKDKKGSGRKRDDR